jgi:hypothetical protein
MQETLAKNHEPNLSMAYCARCEVSNLARFFAHPIYIHVNRYLHTLGKAEDKHKVPQH